MEIRRIQRQDAHIAALLHMEGQPGTFLTTLGEGFLTALYTELGESKYGYGFVAVEGKETLGVIAGTNDTHALFKELLLKRGLHLAVPVLRRLLRQPSLLVKVLQTLAYPGKLDAKPGEAEFLFIGVSSQARRQGIGSRMLEVLIDECRRRGAVGLKSTVDVTNPRANAFHLKYGFHVVGNLYLYGRKMNLYYLPFTSGGLPTHDEPSPHQESQTPDGV